MAKLTRNQTAAAILAHLKTPHAAHPPVTSKALPVQPAPRLHPWFCRYDSAEESVLIYLPEESVTGHRLECSGLTEHGVFPDFYKIPHIFTGTTGDTSSFPAWKVVVSLEVSGSVVTPTFYGTGDQIPDGAIVVAETTKDGIARPVRQYVTGAISLGGGGIEQTLGPLTYESSESRIVQYMGTWLFTPASGDDPARWTFVKATDANGQALPPAVVYESSVANVLLKHTADGEESIGFARAPILFAGNPTNWLLKQTANVTKSVGYNAPTSEADEGMLTATNSTITYFAENGQVSGTPDVLLTTITEEANEATVYEEV